MKAFKLRTDAPLAAWQRHFAESLIEQRGIRYLLVAPVGVGKTSAAILGADKMLKLGKVDSVLVISDAVALRDQWVDVASRYRLDLSKALESQLVPGIATTVQKLRRTSESMIDHAARSRRWLIIADQPSYNNKSLARLIDRMLGANEGSRLLFVARDIPDYFSFDSTYRFDVELLFDREIVQAPATQLQIAQFSPSLALLRDLSRGASAIDAMSWRDFEKVIAMLLERDGYTVELTRGSKDGGVDVIAVKDLGPGGFFKALWQAKKKLSEKNKVGLSVIRELADTRQEFKASKGIIVTTSYLTRGALERVERDRYELGKVDRQDLDAWIKRTLFAK